MTLPDRLRELDRRQHLLARYGLALLVLAVPAFVAQLVDPRTIHGVGLWVKPTKFLVSIGVYAITMAWFAGYIRPERRSAPIVRAAVVMIIAAGTLELAWIGWQAAHGLDSHFNRSTPFFAVMYGLMGLFAVLLTATAPMFAWEIARRPTPGLRSDFRAAVVAGLVLTFALGAGFGIYMSAQTGHAVGAEGGHVPLMGWNRSGGDLRVAHFLGIHAQQAIPLLALLLTSLRPQARWALLGGGTAAYALITVCVFVQAIGGQALI